MIRYLRPKIKLKNETKQPAVSTSSLDSPGGATCEELAVPRVTFRRGPFFNFRDKVAGQRFARRDVPPAGPGRVRGHRGAAGGVGTAPFQPCPPIRAEPLSRACLSKPLSAAEQRGFRGGVRRARGRGGGGAACCLFLGPRGRLCLWRSGRRNPVFLSV